MLSRKFYFGKYTLSPKIPFGKINLSCGNSVPLRVYFSECINYISERSSSRYEYGLEVGDEEKDGMQDGR